MEDSRKREEGLGQGGCAEARLTAAATDSRACGWSFRNAAGVKPRPVGEAETGRRGGWTVVPEKLGVEAPRK